VCAFMYMRVCEYVGVCVSRWNGRMLFWLINIGELMIQYAHMHAHIEMHARVLMVA
jgi:hypothetical protein